MIAIQVQNLHKSYNEQVVLNAVDLVVETGERMGLIGLNGSGKTTLIRCITGEVLPDVGQVHIASGLSLGCLAQLPVSLPGFTAWELIMQSFAHLLEMRQQMHELEERMGLPGGDLDTVMERYARVQDAYERANGYACENTARRILAGLGFKSEEFYQYVDSFSGGQKTRLNLGRLLALSPDILLLDEPTNHLDMQSVEWLEDFIQGYAGTVLVVSHDRMFLDRVATRIAELRGGVLRTYSGNYSTYMEKRLREDLAELRTYEKQQEQIRQTEAYIRRFRAGIKSKQARGRESQLKRMQRLNSPESVPQLKHRKMTVGRESGHDVLGITHVSKAYNGAPLLEDINLQVKKGDKIAIIGPNGCGKTTLLKLIKGLIVPDAGEIRLGSRVDTAYFSQEHSDLNPHQTVLQSIYNNFDLTLEEARSMLGGMLFSEDEVFKQVGELSGGELGRLAFLQVILSGANFLLLDEPTNHLDIPSCQVVEQLLADYPGTVLVVSHDRYFIDRVADGILAIEDGHSQYYWGNYSYYHEKQSEQTSSASTDVSSGSLTASRQAMQYREEQKELQRTRRRLEQDLAVVENAITALENRKRELANWLAEPENYRDETQTRQYSQEYAGIDAKILDAYKEWEDLSGRLSI